MDTNQFLAKNSISPDGAAMLSQYFLYGFYFMVLAAVVWFVIKKIKNKKEDL